METINDIVADLRRRNQGHPLDGEASHCTVEDILRLADRIEATTKREMKIIKNDECYIVEWWDATFSQWRIYFEFLDRADAEKKMSYHLENDKRYGIKSKYRIVRKTIKQEIVYETGNDK